MKTRADRIAAPARVPRRPVKVSRDLWWHCYETGAIIALALGIGAWLIPGTVSLPLMTGILATAAVVAGTAAFVSTRAVLLSAWLLACGTFAAGWFTAARLLGAWSQDVLFWLAAGFVILASAGPPAISHCKSLDDRDPDADERARQLAELGRWKDKFARWGVRGAEITGISRHQDGLHVHGLLGQATDEHGVVTFDRLKAIAPEIVTDLKLAPAAAHFEQPDPDNAAAFILHLRTRKGRRPVTYLPDNDAWTSINEKLELGVHDNGRPFRILFREVAVLVVGVRGSGKSNLLNVLIAQLARCEDVVIFCIDLKGGRVGRAWLMPWIEDRDKIRRPVIDWLATTRSEAMLMLETLIAAGDARAQRGFGAEKLIPKQGRPAVVLIVDESAVATGHGRKDDGVSARQVAVKLATLIETYRSEAIDPVVSATRSDVETMGLTAIKAQSLIRFGLPVGQSGDADSVFPDHHAEARELARISEAGVGLALVKGKMSPPVHFYRITPKLCYRIAARTGPYRPVPDEHLAEAMGEAYENRWKRMEPLLDQWRETAAEWREDAGVPDSDRDAVPAGKRAAVAERPAPGGDVDQQFREIVAGIGDLDGGGRKDAARVRMLSMLRQAGPGGMRVGMLQKQLAAEAAATGSPELAVHRNTLHKWLKQELELGRVGWKGRNMRDPYAYWFWKRQVSDDDPDLGPPGIEVDL